MVLHEFLWGLKQRDKLGFGELTLAKQSLVVSGPLTRAVVRNVVLSHVFHGIARRASND